MGRRAQEPLLSALFAVEELLTNDVEAGDVDERPAANAVNVASKEISARLSKKLLTAVPIKTPAGVVTVKNAKRRIDRPHSNPARTQLTASAKAADDL